MYTKEGLQKATRCFYSSFTSTVYIDRYKAHFVLRTYDGYVINIFERRNLWIVRLALGI